MKAKTTLLIIFITLIWSFNCASQITEAEYFFDADPGVGIGIALTIASGNAVNETFAIPTTGLTSGLHVLHIRVKGTNNVWSLFNRDYFYVNAINTKVPKPIVEAEYFFDTDLGVGNATALTLDNGFTIDETFAIQVPSDLTDGNHYIHIRAKDNEGNWSLYRWALLEVDSTLSIEDLDSTNFVIYPNPSSDFITIFSSFEIENVKLYNTLGKLVYTNTLNQNQINVSNLSSGIYILKIKSIHGELTKKVAVK